MASLGTLYGVSLGPGDPELITRRAWALLRRRNVHWTWPVRVVGGESFALSIALAAGLALPASSEPLLFPMTRDEARLAAAWQEAAQRVIAVLRQGRDVLFLVEGDASTYSSFGYLARNVRALEARILIETVAGVTSFNAAAARVPMALAAGDETVAILPAGQDLATVDRLLGELDSLVLLKVAPQLDALIDLLARHDRLDEAVLIEKTGTSEERIVRHLASLRGLRVGYLSLVLVRRKARPGR